MNKPSGRQSKQGILLPQPRFLTAFASLMLVLAGSTRFACSAPAAPVNGKIVIIISATANGDDLVGITYPGMVPHAQVSRDVQALATLAGWTPANVEITDDKSPTKATRVMTGVVFTAHNAIDPDAHCFALEPIVTSMRAYPRMALIYLVGSNYNFQGLRSYNDRYVSIQLDEHGTAYQYAIAIHDPGFQKLNLPLYQPVASHTASVPARAGRRRVSPWQIVLLTVVAALAGGTVYVITSRQT